MIIIKGPLQRIHYDVRRIWNCPQCHRTVKTAGTVVFKRCNCQPEGVWMQILPRPDRKFEIHETYSLEDSDADNLEEGEERAAVENQKTSESSEEKSAAPRPNPPQQNATEQETEEKSNLVPQDELMQDEDDSNEEFDSGIFED